jgi:hypothetical protein
LPCGNAREEFFEGTLFRTLFEENSMPREPKPYYRKAQKRWVCTINGTRVTFGKTKEQAMVKYHQLMLNPSAVSSELSTVYQLAQAYLDWVQEHRKEGTYENQRRYLKSFVGSIGKSMKISALRKHHVLSHQGNGVFSVFG